MDNLHDAASTADLAFVALVWKRGLMTQEELDDALIAAQSRNQPIDAYLDEIQALSPSDHVAILQGRARYARDCTSSTCDQTTYLLPKQRDTQTPCEHCGSPLVVRPSQRIRSPSGRHTAPPSTSRHERPQAPPDTRSHARPGPLPYSPPDTRSASRPGQGERQSGSGTYSRPPGSGSFTPPSGQVVVPDGSLAPPPPSRQRPIPAPNIYRSDSRRAQRPVPAPDIYRSDSRRVQRPVPAPNIYRSDSRRVQRPVPAPNVYRSDSRPLPRPSHRAPRPVRRDQATRPQTWLGEFLADLRDNGHKQAMVVAVCVVFPLLIYTGFRINHVMSGIDFHVHDGTSSRLAAERGTLKIVYITDPQDPVCRSFRKRVLKSDEVLAIADQYVWQKERPSRGNDGSVNRSSDYAGLEKRGSGKLPHIIIYSAGNEVLGGTIGVEGMTPDEFVEMILEAEGES